MLGMLAHQLAAELERILTGGMGKLVHEALEIDGVLVVVHAAPEPWRDRRVAHGMVDQQVRDGVADRAFRAAGIETLERGRIAPILKRSRIDGGKDGLAGNAHVQPGEFIVGIERAGELALRDRVIDAVRGVVFARLDQLDRRPRHLLGDPHCVRHVLAPRSSAETAAEDRVVHVALLGRQSACFRGGRQRCFTVLRAGPHLALSLL